MRTVLGDSSERTFPQKSDLFEVGVFWFVFSSCDFVDRP